MICFFFVYKGLILLNDQKLLETLMSDLFFQQTFGALEWDPEGLVQERYNGDEEQLEDSIQDQDSFELETESKQRQSAAKSGSEDKEQQ